MAKFTVSADVMFPILMEIEADNEDQAYEKLYAESPKHLMALASTETLEIIDGSIEISPGE